MRITEYFTVFIFVQDMMFTNDKCLYLTFIVKGGSYNPVNKKIQKHETVPAFSNDRVCIRPCGAGENSRDV